MIILNYLVNVKKYTIYHTIVISYAIKNLYFDTLKGIKMFSVHFVDLYNSERQEMSSIQVHGQTYIPTFAIK